ncbi:hypothetical protein [Rhodococcus sp. NPDC058521]|uniref:hypothetical protein n=1 Tax=Rhodococcus sp. NPDC058521 TaxID=3346536 RepID=UPI003651CC54
MDPLEYSFGAGVDAPTTWTSLTDLSVGAGGSLDAVRLDFDGDGLLDDAMWDFDGDGVADHSVLDIDDQDEVRFFTDVAGDGTWSHEVPRPVVPDPSPPAEPEVGSSRLDHSPGGSSESRPVSFGTSDVGVAHDPILVPSGNVGRPDLVFQSDAAVVRGDGEQSECIDAGGAEGQRQ